MIFHFNFLGALYRTNEDASMVERQNANNIWIVANGLTIRSKALLAVSEAKRLGHSGSPDSKRGVMLL